MKTEHRGWTVEVKEGHGRYLSGSWWFELTNCTEKIVSGAIVYDTAKQALEEGKTRIDKIKNG